MIFATATEATEAKADKDDDERFPKLWNKLNAWDLVPLGALRYYSHVDTRAKGLAIGLYAQLSVLKGPKNLSFEKRY